jgi:hypothetical protein
MTTRQGAPAPSVMDAADFEALYQELRSASGRGSADRRGALNNITQTEVLAALGEV